MRESPSYIRTKVIDIPSPVASGAAIDLFNDYGLSETIHLFGIVGNVKGPSSSITSNVSFRDGLSGDDFFKFDVTSGVAGGMGSFLFMMEEDSYIRINEGLVVVATSSNGADFTQLAFTVVYQ